MANNRVVEFLQAKFRLKNDMTREFLAEFLGTFILIVSTAVLTLLLKFHNAVFNQTSKMVDYISMLILLV